MKRLLIFLKRNWKNATVVTVSLSIIAGSLVYLNQTNAYLVDNTPQKANTFSTYEVDISVVYRQTDGSYVEGDIFENTTETGGSISDGMDLDENVHIRNDGDLPCYVRVIPTFNYVNDREKAWYFKEWLSGVRVYLADAPKAEDGTNADGSTYSADYSVEYNTTDWLLDENTGILYYTKPLQPTEVTTYIFSNFDSPEDDRHESYTINGETKKAHFTIDVSADAIQCERAANMAETSIPAVCTRWGVTLKNGKAEDAIVAVPPANFYHLDANNTLGMTFDSKLYYRAESKFTSQIKTFEATVLLPNGYAGRGGVIMGTYNGTNDQDTVNFELGSDDSRYYDCPRIYVANSSGTTYEYIFTSVHLADGKWHHVAMTWDGTRMYLYVDGKKCGSNNGTAYSSIVPNRNIAVAGDYRSGNSEYFKGMIRNVTLYSDVRTAAEIQADVTRSVYAPDTDNILASYNLADFAGGTSIADVSGKGNELFITN